MSQATSQPLRSAKPSIARMTPLSGASYLMTASFARSW
jgi:hypothetical protein